MIFDHQHYFQMQASFPITMSDGVTHPGYFRAFPATRSELACAASGDIVELTRRLLVAPLFSGAPPAIDDLASRARAIQATIDELRSNAAMARAAVDARYPPSATEDITRIEAVKVAALEAEAVRLDGALEVLRDTHDAVLSKLGESHPGRDGLLSGAFRLCDILASLSLLPRAPVEPALLALRPVVRSGLDAVIAPRGASISIVSEVKVLASALGFARDADCLELMLQCDEDAAACAVTRDSVFRNTMVNAELVEPGPVPEVGAADGRSFANSARVTPLQVCMRQGWGASVFVRAILPDGLPPPGSELRITAVYVAGEPLLGGSRGSTEACLPVRLPISTAPRAPMKLSGVVSGVIVPAVVATGAVFVGGAVFAADGSRYPSPFPGIHGQVTAAVPLSHAATPFAAILVSQVLLTMRARVGPPIRQSLRTRGRCRWMRDPQWSLQSTSARGRDCGRRRCRAAHAVASPSCQTRCGCCV